MNFYETWSAARKNNVYVYVNLACNQFKSISKAFIRG